DPPFESTGGGDLLPESVAQAVAVGPHAPAVGGDQLGLDDAPEPRRLRSEGARAGGKGRCPRDRGRRPQIVQRNSAADVSEPAAYRQAARPAGPHPGRGTGSEPLRAWFCL